MRLHGATRDDITQRELATARSIGTGQRVGQMIAMAIARAMWHITRFDTRSAGATKRRPRSDSSRYAR